MIVIVSIGDVGAVAVLDFDLETVALAASVVDGIEIVDAAVSDAGFCPCTRSEQGEDA